MNQRALACRIKYYLDNYELLFRYDHNQGKTQIIDSNLTDKVCRFCGKRYPEVKFKKKAHAISEMLGNKEFVIRNECDTCNEFFGKKLEDDFSKYLGLGRTLSQIYGSNGVPSYKSRDGKCRIDFTNEGLVIQKTEDSKDIEILDGRIIFHAVRDPYTPVAVYKALVKMALSLLPYERMSFFQDTVAWLKEDSHIVSKYDMSRYQCVIERFVPGPMPLQMRAIGFIRKSIAKNLPYYIFLLEFANQSFQIIVPCTRKDEFTEVNLVQVPGTDETVGPTYGAATTKYIDLSGKKKVENDPLELCLGYQKMEKHDANGMKIDELLEEKGIDLKNRLSFKEKK